MDLSRHALSRPSWVSTDSNDGWVVTCACGQWRSEPSGSLKALKAQGAEHRREGMAHAA